jgi:hypothetical protein
MTVGQSVIFVKVRVFHVCLLLIIRADLFQDP